MGREGALIPEVASLCVCEGKENWKVLYWPLNAPACKRHGSLLLRNSLARMSHVATLSSTAAGSPTNATLSIGRARMVWSATGLIITHCSALIFGFVLYFANTSSV